MKEKPKAEPTVTIASGKDVAINVRQTTTSDAAVVVLPADPLYVEPDPPDVVVALSRFQKALAEYVPARRSWLRRLLGRPW